MDDAAENRSDAFAVTFGDRSTAAETY